MGETVESFASPGGARVTKNPHPASAQLNELAGRDPRVILGFETATIQELCGCVGQFAFGDDRLSAVPVVQPPGEMTQSGLDQVASPQFLVDATACVPPAEQQVGALLVDAGPVLGKRALAP